MVSSVSDCHEKHTHGKTCAVSRSGCRTARRSVICIGRPHSIRRPHEGRGAHVVKDGHGWQGSQGQSRKEQVISRHIASSHQVKALQGTINHVKRYRTEASQPDTRSRYTLHTYNLSPLSTTNKGLHPSQETCVWTYLLICHKIPCSLASPRAPRGSRTIRL